MRSRVLVVGLVVLTVALAGCTNVQKGAGVGASVGAVAGAGYGHYLAGVGGATGGAIGLGVGALGGMLAADNYYGEEQNEDIERAKEMGEQMAARVQEKEAQVAGLRAELDKEKAQQNALLKALEETRTELNTALTAKGTASDSVSVDNARNTLTVTFQSEVFFNSGKAKLSEKGKQALREAARAVRKQFPDSKIEIVGHTDNVPIKYSGHASNRHLSCLRAASVVDYLVKVEGFNPDRLLATGMGETRPIASNSTAAGRAKNRRVELIVRPARSSS